MDKVVFNLDKEAIKYEFKHGICYFRGYCNILMKEYDITIKVNDDNSIVTITGESNNIVAMLNDGHFGELIIGDTRVEYDKQHGVDEFLQGNWDI